MIYSKEYVVEQDSQRDDTKKNYYKWAVWIKALEGDLSEVERVEYLLHPTFPNRLRISSDASNGFRIESKGWGEFRIDISIIKKESAGMLQLAHWLVLSDEDNEVVSRGVPDEIEAKKVYISYSKIDTRTAQTLENMLADLGMEVASGSDIQPGVSMKKYIEESIDSADVVITINPGNENDWQKAEIEIAEGFQKNIIPIDSIIDTEESTSVFSSNKYSEEDYGSTLKSLGNQIKNLKL